MSALPRAGGSTLGVFDVRLGRVEIFFNLVAAAFIFVLMFLGMAQVLGRQLFNHPINGYIDFVELSMATFAFLGVAYCQRLGGHVRMEMLLKVAPDRMRWVMEVIGTLVALFVIAVLTWYSFDHFLRAYRLGDSTIDAELPVWPSKLIVPISFALLWLRLLVQLLGYLRLVANPATDPVGIPRTITAEDIAAQDAEGSR